MRYCRRQDVQLLEDELKRPRDCHILHSMGWGQRTDRCEANNSFKGRGNQLIRRVAFQGRDVLQQHLEEARQVLGDRAVGELEVTVARHERDPDAEVGLVHTESE